MMHLYIPSIPPTTNKAYTSRKGSKARVLTEEGRRYKRETVAHIARMYMLELNMMRPNRPYHVAIEISFPPDAVYTKGWGHKSSVGRFKALDITNRIKLLEDAFAEATGVDDKHHFVVLLSKVCNKEVGTHLWIWSIEEERSPIDDLLSVLRETESHRAVSALPGSHYSSNPEHDQGRAD